MMTKKRKEAYVSPRMEVIRMENEGVIAASGGLDGLGNGGKWGNVSNTRSTPYGGTRATESDIEEMLNDLFTVEQ